MENKNADVVLEKFWAEKSWDNFLPVLKELDGLIRRRVLYFSKSFAAYETTEDMVSRIQIFIYEKVCEYRPGGRVSISSYVNRQIVFYLKNTLTVYARRGEVLSYTSSFSNVAISTTTSNEGVNSLYHLIDEFKDELSGESREFLGYLLKDQQTIRSMVSLLESKRVKARHPSYYNAIRIRFETLKGEIQNLVLQKNLKFS